MELTIKKDASESYFIRHPEFSYAIFSISETGDLMINSDWGQSNFAWRSFGEVGMANFKQFLSELNEGYWKIKMEYNMSYLKCPKAVINHFTKNVWPIFQILQAEFKKELTPVNT